MPDVSVQDLIRQEATKAGVPASLALAVAEQESSFNPTAINGKSGALGTFQLLPDTAKVLGVDPHDPVQNISGGVKYLRQLLDAHQGDLTGVLKTYGGVQTDTTYVPGVMARIAKFEQGPAATAGQSTVPPPAPTLLQATRSGLKPDQNIPAGPPKPTLLGGPGAVKDTVASVAKGLDPRTEQGRRNLAGGAASVGATLLAPEVALPAWAARIAGVAIPVLGAAAGGAAENLTEQGVRKVTGSAPSDSSVGSAALEQGGQELLGQAGSKLIAQPIFRRLAAPGISAKISSGFTESLGKVQSSIDALDGQLSAARPAVTAAKAGELVHATANQSGGGVRSIKDELGQAVGAAAESGPPLPAKPLLDEIDRIMGTVNPEAAAVATSPTARPAAALTASPVPSHALTITHTAGPSTVPHFAGFQNAGNGIAYLQFDTRNGSRATADQVRSMFPDANIQVIPFAPNVVRPDIQRFRIDAFGLTARDTIDQMEHSVGGTFRDWMAPVAVHAEPAGATSFIPAGQTAKSMSAADITAAQAKLRDLIAKLDAPEMADTNVGPLPGTLARVRRVLETAVEANGGDAETATIPFAAGHKSKRLLDAVVDWGRTAKQPTEQVTKGFRQTLRESMASHAPYNQATTEYGAVANLYTKPVKALQKQATQNPESLVSSISWKKPTSTRLLKELLHDTPAAAGDPTAIAEGQGAFSAVRAAWTQEQLIAKGPAGMSKEIARMEASNSGQDFIQSMYGDPQGQTVWGNLKQIADRLAQLSGSADTIKEGAKDFAASDLSRVTPISGMVRDFVLATAHGHPIGKVGAGARLVFGRGTSSRELIQWAAYAPSRTRFLIDHVLTGPNPGQAFADMVRWYQGGAAPAGMPARTGAAPPALSTGTSTVQGTSGPPPAPSR